MLFKWDIITLTGRGRHPALRRLCVHELKHPKVQLVSFKASTSSFCMYQVFLQLASYYLKKTAFVTKVEGNSLPQEHSLHKVISVPRS